MSKGGRKGQKETDRERDRKPGRDRKSQEKKTLSLPKVLFLQPPN